MVARVALTAYKELTAVLRCLTSPVPEAGKHAVLTQAALAQDARLLAVGADYRRAVTQGDWTVRWRAAAQGLVLAEPCAAVPLPEDGSSGLPLVEPALLERHVAYPRLQGVPVLPLVEQV